MLCSGEIMFFDHKKSRRFAVLICGWLCGFSIPITLAAESLTLSEALRKTSENNLLLLQYPFFQQQMAAELKQAKIRPQPVLSLEVENVLGSGQLEGFDGAETTLMLSQQIELGDKRQSRINFATAETKRRAIEFEATRLRVLAETSRRYYSLLNHDAQEALLVKRIKQEKSALRLIQQRAKAGAVSEVDVRKMALHLEKSQTELLALRQSRKLLKMALASQWVSLPNFDRVSGNILTMPRIPSMDHVNNAIAQSPEYLLKQAEIMAAQGQLKLEQSRSKADLALGGGVKYLNDQDSFGLTFTASMPINFSNPNAGRIESASSQYQLSQQQAESAAKMLSITLHQLHQKTLLLRSEINWINQRLLPKAKSLLQASQDALSKGQISVLQWADSEDEVFTLEAALIQNHTQIYLNLLDIEQVTGASLSASSRVEGDNE
jgi:cobalt-zinc-cadmium efflux system outer membrane protein